MPQGNDASLRGRKSGNSLCAAEERCRDEQDPLKMPLVVETPSLIKRKAREQLQGGGAISVFSRKKSLCRGGCIKKKRGLPAPSPPRTSAHSLMKTLKKYASNDFFFSLFLFFCSFLQ